jgi:hypothetical protein
MPAQPAPPASTSMRAAMAMAATSRGPYRPPPPTLCDQDPFGDDRPRDTFREADDDQDRAEESLTGRECNRGLDPRASAPSLAALERQPPQQSRTPGPRTALMMWRMRTAGDIRPVYRFLQREDPPLWHDCSRARQGAAAQAGDQRRSWLIARSKSRSIFASATTAASASSGSDGCSTASLSSASRCLVPTAPSAAHASTATARVR